MKKIIIIVFALFTLTSCGWSSDENKPYTNGPGKSPDLINGPESAPEGVSTKTGDETDKERILRTHQTIDKIYVENGVTKEIFFTYNLDGGHVKGMLHGPSFTDEKVREAYQSLSSQVLYKNIDEIGEIKPNPEVPGLSKAFIEATAEAIEGYKKANNLN